MSSSRPIESLWQHLHGLTLLGELGSYTAAAQRLSLSKAAMSQRIAELERAAGVALVRRTTRSVQLTDAGRELVESTRGAFEQIGHAFAGIRDLAQAPRGTVRVTVPVALGRQHVAPRLPDFLRAHPEVRIELELSDTLVPLAREGFDLAIRHTSHPPETHVAWTLCETQSVLVSSRAYLRKRGTPQAPGDLREHDCLHYLRRGESPVWSFQPASRAAGKAGPVAVPVAGPLAMNNSEALRDAAIAGLGITLLPDFSAQAALRTGKLVRVLPEWRPLGNFGDKLYAIRPYAPYTPRAVQALVAFLREALKPGFGV